MTEQSKQPLELTTYIIRVKGQLAADRSAWFDDMQVATDVGRRETTLTGALVDQAALYGVLLRIRDLGLTLLSVNQQSPEAALDDL